MEDSRRSLYPIVFKTVVGSRAYGTNVETSDTDYKGVYIQPNEDLLGFKYREQLDFGKDETYYEIRRFIQLVSSANPTILEMLFVDDKHVLVMHPAFQYLRDIRKTFLTKNCQNSFGGYAVAQIRKAKGLDKKFNWERERTVRKTVLDFCYVHESGKSMPVEKWLRDNQLKQKNVGLVALPHMPDAYALYYDHIQDHLDAFGPGAQQRGNVVGRGYRGIVSDDGNDVRLSSVAKTDPAPLTVMTFNKEGYSMHCKDYREYEAWLQARNEARYTDIRNHDQKVDGKNLMHCRRLIDMAMEIAATGDLTVTRPNTEYLLDIRRGKVPLDEILEQAEADVKALDALYENSSLPAMVTAETMHEHVLRVRELYWRDPFNT
jgi:hypothetical protein